MAKLLTSLLALATLAGSGFVFAHPHPEILSSAELIKRQEFQTYSRRSLGDCASKLKARGGVAERAISRRAEFARKVREARGLDAGGPFKRDLATILATDHHSNRTDITTDSDADAVFDGNTTCVLAATGEVGPFFVKGEYVRSDLTEDQEGVDLYVDLQFIDVSTCEPLSGVYVDTWSANATGVYSGVVATGNGVGDDDPSNINTTFLRGIQETSDEGFIQFHTLFPGHYTGRTHHVHLVVHQTDGTLNENGTYTGGSYTHHGQVFFDQSLITEVNELSPYSTNNGTLTTNDEDRVLSDEQDVDPVLEYVLLGDTLSDGILGWISLGINTTANVEVDAASVLTTDGGVANDTASGPGDLPSGSAFPSSGVPSDSALFPSASA